MAQNWLNLELALKEQKSSKISLNTNILVIVQTKPCIYQTIFYHPIYPSDLPVLFMVRNVYRSDLIGLFMV